MVQLSSIFQLAYIAARGPDAKAPTLYLNHRDWDMSPSTIRARGTVVDYWNNKLSRSQNDHDIKYLLKEYERLVRES
jgi:hypothetical protein